MNPDIHEPLDSRGCSMSRRAKHRGLRQPAAALGDAACCGEVRRARSQWPGAGKTALTGSRLPWPKAAAGCRSPRCFARLQTQGPGGSLPPHPPHRRRATGGFTLLELVLVLAILATVTALATRELSHVEDQRRFDISQRTLADIEAAVLGSPDDRAADGSRTVSGFVADMGRLPVVVQMPGSTDLTLAELWMPPVPVVAGRNPLYSVRQASVDNGVPEADVDAQVFVAGGWRGPFLRLPIGAGGVLRDGWGNPFISPLNSSPPDPTATGYARLRKADGTVEGVAPTSVGDEISLVRHLGANGKRDVNDSDENADIQIDLIKGLPLTVRATIQVIDDKGAPSVISGSVVVRIFGPDPRDPSKVEVKKNDTPITTVPATTTINGATAGTRVIRAYLTDALGITTSSIKYVTLIPGENFIPLTIFRP
ncbi:MAG: prepilin-type cleavage/methylation protein [Verrucomicrobiaceae bacterium]|nr:prepilin-type cleavage/methylation protein [Verrucomicrobiaceae bacterium]